MKLTHLFLNLVFSLLLFACSSTLKVDKSPSPPLQKADWIQKSNKVAEEFTKAMAQLYPEAGSQIGYTEYDKLGLLLDIKIQDKTREFFLSWLEKLQSEKKQTKDIELLTDFDVLQSWLQNQIQNIDISQAEHEIEFSAGIQFIYENLKVLVNPQSSADRKFASVDRLRVYIYGTQHHSPLLVAMKEKFQHQLQKYHGKKMFLPFHDEVEQYLKDSESYLTGIEEILKSSGRVDWYKDLALLKKQAADYDKFVKNVVLKNSRRNPQVSNAIYSQILKRRGIDSTPQQLIKKGLSDYKIIYRQFENQSKVVAKKYNLANTDPAVSQSKTSDKTTRNRTTL